MKSLENYKVYCLKFPLEVEVSTTEYSYSVKVINPGGKGGYEMHALESHSIMVH